MLQLLSYKIGIIILNPDSQKYCGKPHYWYLWRITPVNVENTVFRDRFEKCLVKTVQRSHTGQRGEYEIFIKLAAAHWMNMYTDVVQHPVEKTL